MYSFLFVLKLYAAIIVELNIILPIIIFGDVTGNRKHYLLFCKRSYDKEYNDCNITCKLLCTVITYN